MAKRATSTPPTMTPSQVLPLLTADLEEARRIDKVRIGEGPYNAWASITEENLISAFGDGSPLVNAFKDAADNGKFSISVMGSGVSRPQIDYDKIRGAAMKDAMPLLERAIATLSLRPTTGPASTALTDTREVFIVHGHDDAMKHEVARFVAGLSLTPIILAETPNGGKTVIEKLERQGTTAAFAIVLLTPDDVGSKAGGQLKPRARQNVILELGYFFGKISRARVCALVKEGSEPLDLPSDYIGVVYTPFSGDWKISLFNELRGVWKDIRL